MSPVCPDCQQPVEPGDAECSLCGRDLSSVAQPRVDAPPQPPPDPRPDIAADRYAAPPVRPEADTSPFPPQQPYPGPGGDWQRGGPAPAGWRDETGTSAGRVRGGEFTGAWGGSGADYRREQGPPVDRRRSTARVAIALAIALVIVGVGAAGFLRRSGGPAASASTPGASTSVTGAGTTSSQPVVPTPTTESPQPSTESSSIAPASSYPPVTITGHECGRVGAGPYAAAAAGNDHTSCAFAVAVRNAYLASGASGSATTLQVYSTVTKKSYAMACGGDQPVTCTGGNDAVVFLYGGVPTFS